MTIPINLFFWTLCIIPIIVLLILMIKFQWGASKAAPFTLVVTIVLGVLFFKANGRVLTSELLKASWNSTGIILVIITAILLYEVGNEAHAFDTLNILFKKLAPNELIRVLMIGIVFASFLQGITGFGVPVLITAPLLLNIGVAPVYAVIIPLLGHSWAGTFGTLALGWNALLIQTGIQDKTLILQTAIYASIFLFVLTVLFSFIITFFYGRWQAVKKGFVAVAVITLIQGGGQLVFSTFNPELAAFIPSAISLLAIIALSKTPLYREPWELKNSKIMVRTNPHLSKKAEQKLTTNQALLPYYLVTGISLLILLIPPITNVLGSFSFGPGFSQTETSYGVINPAIEHYAPLTPLTHASMFLLVSSLITYVYYRRKGLIKKTSLVQLSKRAFKKALSPSIAVLSLLSISRVMAGTGQTFVLAQGISAVLQENYVFIAPFIGLLGSFITGSNMSSNILFGDFQMQVSEFIGLKTAAVLGAQTGGGGIGTSIAPGNIILGTTTAGILGSEGKVLIKIIPFTLTVAAIFGVLLFLDYHFI